MAGVSKHSSVNGRIINILGFAGQEAKLRVLCEYLYNKREGKLHEFLNDESQIIIVIEYFFAIQVD